MTDIADALNIIQQEETDFNSSISEATLTRMGALSNLIANRSNKAFDFKFLGPFRDLNGGEDGARGLIWDAEIVGISGYIRLTGSSGTTTIDIHSITGSTDNGTILNTKLAITSAASDGVSFYTNFLDASSSGGTGITLPTFTAPANRQLNAGDALRVDVDGNATGAYDLTVNIHYRPYTS